VAEAVGGGPLGALPLGGGSMFDGGLLGPTLLANELKLEWGSAPPSIWTIKP